VEGNKIEWVVQCHGWLPICAKKLILRKPLNGYADISGVAFLLVHDGAKEIDVFGTQLRENPQGEYDITWRKG
jgi:hypothetical protein